MKTFAEAKSFVDDKDYYRRRKESIIELVNSFNSNSIDVPIKDIVKGFCQIPYCFTLQSCYGHFVHEYNRDERNIEPISRFTDKKMTIEYRIAYMAFCLQNNRSGRKLFNDLKTTSEIDSRNIQFGSADWFWERCVNSYVIQVEPESSKFEDSSIINLEEANYIESIRDQFFARLKDIMDYHMKLMKE